MSNDRQKIQLVIEAYNMAKGTLDQLGKQIKGIGDETGKADKQTGSFMKSMKENWIAITAAAAAAGVAISKALEYMELGAKAEQAEASFRQVAEASGESADEILENMKRAAAGTVDDSDIMQKAVKGMMQGLNGDQLTKIMEAARISARVTGEDVGTAYETITDAIANKMPRALLKYGLVSKEQVQLLSEAMSMGITDVDLYALAMENAGKQMEKFGDVQGNNAEKMQKLKAWWNDLKETVGSAIWSFGSGIKSFALGTVDIVMGLMSGGIAGIMGLATLAQTALNKVGIVSDETLAKTKADFEKLKNLSATYFKAAFGKAESPLSGGGTGTDPSFSGSGGGRGTGAQSQLEYEVAMKAREAEIMREMAYLDIAEKNRDISHLDAARERLRIEERLLSVQQANLKPINDPNQRAAKQKEIDDTIRKISDLRLALRELDGTFQEGIDEGLKRYNDSLRSRFQEGVYIAQETARGMEQAFSEFFFDAMTGKLKSFWQYIKSFLLSVARAISNILAQQSVIAITGIKNAENKTGTTAVGGALISDPGANVGGSGYGQPPVIGPYFKHSGGLIMHSGGYIPRFHVGGLSSDERPAILQTGEYVVSRKGVAALDRINKGDVGNMPNVSISVINQSGVQLDAQVGKHQFDGERYIATVLLKLANTSPAVRSAFGIGQ
ncbi:MAG: hypothetical protein OEW15_04830 [Nitrospirota bacterium]|nr:hypothetical protein [Nitrospirota bacterium]